MTGPVARGVGLVEPIEDEGQVLGRDAGPAVRDRQHHAAVRAAAGQRDAAVSRRVADGVGDQVLQHLLEPPRVADHGLGVRRDLALECDAASRRAPPRDARPRDRRAASGTASRSRTDRRPRAARDPAGRRRWTRGAASPRSTMPQIASARRVVLHRRRAAPASRGSRASRSAASSARARRRRATGVASDRVLQILHAGLEVGGHPVEATRQRRPLRRRRSRARGCGLRRRRAHRRPTAARAAGAGRDQRRRAPCHRRPPQAAPAAAIPSGGPYFAEDRRQRRSRPARGPRRRSRGR